MSGQELAQRNAAKKAEGQPRHEASDRGDRSVVVAIFDHPENVKKIEIVSKLQDLDKRSKAAKTAREQPNTTDGSKKSLRKPKIQMVPQLLQRRKKDKDSINYFEPRLVSIGPIHHSLKLEKNDDKVQLAAQFIAKGSPAQVLFDAIKSKISEFKEQFKEEVLKELKYDDDTLSLMFVVDGCFILEFIINSVKEEDGDSVMTNINQKQAALIKQDLFLLENQIPFQVLETLMDSRKDDAKSELENSIKKFIKKNAMSPEYSKNITLEWKVNENSKPVHLLDLLRSALVPKEEEEDSKKKQQEKPSEKEYNRTFRNLQDLKTAGIEFKPSKTCSLRDVSFSSFCFSGCLKLPPLIIDDSTKRKLFNLVAYEMCPDSSLTDQGVACYLYFLDSLVDIEEDAKDLRMANIIRNRLSSDGEVAQFFNDIGRDLVPSPAYVDVKIKVQEHYGSKVRIWMAQAYNLHFSSPWTVLALIGALIVLALTAGQTWFTIYPR